MATDINNGKKSAPFSCPYVAALFALAAVFGFGCSDPVHVDLTNLPGPPGSSFQGDNLKLTPGTALILDARPKESDGDPVDTTVEIVAAAPFEVLKTTTRNRFAIVATAPGHATLRIVVDGQDVRTLTADAP